MKYETLTHAFYIAEHIPTMRDMLKIHFKLNSVDITAKPPTKHFIGAIARLKF